MEEELTETYIIALGEVHNDEECCPEVGGEEDEREWERSRSSNSISSSLSSFTGSKAGSSATRVVLIG